MPRKSKPDVRPPWRREKITRFVSRGDLVAAVPVEVVWPDENWLVYCYEAATVEFLEEVGRKLEEGDIEYLQSIGEVFKAVKNGTRKSRRLLPGPSATP